MGKYGSIFQSGDIGTTIVDHHQRQSGQLGYQSLWKFMFSTKINVSRQSDCSAVGIVGIEEVKIDYKV